MLLGANTDLFNPLVPKAHNTECQNIFPLQITPVKSVRANWWIFIFCTFSINGLTKQRIRCDLKVLRTGFGYFMVEKKTSHSHPA